MVFITPYSKKIPLNEGGGRALVRALRATGALGALGALGASHWSLPGLLYRLLCVFWARVALHLSITLIALSALLTLAGANEAHAQNVSSASVQLTDFKLERQDDAYLLSSALSFELPQAVEDALSKGIALYFMAEVQVSKERWYWYDKYLARQERHYRLSYNPLSRRWRLASSSKPIPNSGLGVTLGVAYDSLGEALSAIKRSSEWRVVDASEIEPSGKYRLDYQFKLDLTQFPRPFQIGTLGESDWTMSVKRSQALVFEPLKSP